MCGILNDAVYEENNATQRAKYVAEQKFCFARFNCNNLYRYYTEVKMCPKPECESSYNVSLHGDNKRFLRKKNFKFSIKAGAGRFKENTNISTHAVISDIWDNESSKGLLPIAKLCLTSDVRSPLAVFFFICIGSFLSVSVSS